ncbi:MAG: hypothetical protein ACYT04_53675 [Nostoc sp.]
MRSHLLKRFQKPGFFAPDFGLTKSDSATVLHLRPYFSTRRCANGKLSNHRRHRYVLGDVYDKLLCLHNYFHFTEF